jgi:hypothetical protein
MSSRSSSGEVVLLEEEEEDSVTCQRPANSVRVRCRGSNCLPAAAAIPDKGP